MHHPVVLFDGTCNLCNGAVQFILDHERGPTLKFAALQSEIAAELLSAALDAETVRRVCEGEDGSGDPDTVVFVEDGRVFTHSAAALRISRHLRRPWRWAAALSVVPRVLRDGVYRWVARHRYRWFGKEETCRVPTPELRARFL